jgi:hypothetical protein
MKDPIHLCDVVLFDGKLKREYLIYDVVLVGNNKEMIWQSEIHRNRLIQLAFKTPSKVKTQRNNMRLYIKDIDFKKYISDSDHNWGLSK